MLEGIAKWSLPPLEARRAKWERPEHHSQSGAIPGAVSIGEDLGKHPIARFVSALTWKGREHRHRSRFKIQNLTVYFLTASPNTRRKFPPPIFPTSSGVKPVFNIASTT